MRAHLKYLSVVVLFLLSSCSLYRVAVIQGKEITPAQIQQLCVGMDKAQVQYILGKPLLRDDFSPNRWDYAYYDKNTKGQVHQSKSLSVFFDTHDKVVKIARQ